MTTENETSLTLTFVLIGFALLIAAISKASSTADQSAGPALRPDPRLPDRLTTVAS